MDKLFFFVILKMFADYINRNIANKSFETF